MNGDFLFGKSAKDAFSSDLACERHRADLNVPGVSYQKTKSGPFIWERIRISSREAEKAIGRPSGYYDTLCTERMDLLSDGEIEDAGNEIAKELCSIFEKSFTSPAKILVAGLGNSELTPDSIGPKTARLVNPTTHLRELEPGLFGSFECSEISVFIPGVIGNTGIESSDAVSAICDTVNPDAVIAIDAIASKSVQRLGTTIQISNTGIFPGSGIGNRRKGLLERTLGVPVIAIGVPTVISARAFCSPESSGEECGMFVSPRDIDTITKVSAKIISHGINQAFGVF